MSALGTYRSKSRIPEVDADARTDKEAVMGRMPFLVLLLLFPISVSAEPSPCPAAPSGAMSFDAYKPSHLSILRNYGATMLAQAPLETLLKLDPYVPVEGALLRQLGGAIPVWSYPPLAWHPPAAPSGPCVSVPDLAPAVLTSFSDVVSELGARAPLAAGRTGPATSERNRGISIEYDGRVWVSAGPAVAFSSTQFVRVGDRAGAPVYQRAGTKESVIYISTMAGMVAPFRAGR
jgi:hypothetical protein